MLVVTLAFAASLAGCGGEEGGGGGGAPEARPGPEARGAAAPGAGGSGERGSGGSAPALEPVPCPPRVAGCRSATGTVLYVEAVDPDGDGDAHFVLASDAAVTAPGITVVDVRRDLRPRLLPGIGDRISAAGPVFRGSYGQRQIEAVALRVARGPERSP